MFFGPDGFAADQDCLALNREYLDKNQAIDAAD